MDLLWLCLVVINAFGFLMMGLDKLGAKVDSGRVPELWFFLISLCEGFCGILLGMIVFHHKVSKRSFQLKIIVAAILGAIALLLVVRA
jgi:uncharacterized membrane protein YsdA (DUF1294 family)